MIFLFTRKNTIFSKLIRLFTGEEISHFVLYFDDIDIVFHSFRKGVEIDWYKRFSKNYEIVYRLEAKSVDDKKVYKQIIDKYLGRPYDIGALVFWTVIILAKRMFGYAYNTNLWGSKKALLCTELVRAVKELDVINDIVWPEKLDMLTPKELFILLKESKYVTESKNPL